VSLNRFLEAKIVVIGVQGTPALKNQYIAILICFGDIFKDYSTIQK